MDATFPAISWNFDRGRAHPGPVLASLEHRIDRGPDGFLGFAGSRDETILLDAFESFPGSEIAIGDYFQRAIMIDEGDERGTDHEVVPCADPHRFQERAGHL